MEKLVAIDHEISAVVQEVASTIVARCTPEFPVNEVDEVESHPQPPNIDEVRVLLSVAGTEPAIAILAVVVLVAVLVW